MGVGGEMTKKLIIKKKHQYEYNFLSLHFILIKYNARRYSKILQ